MYLIAVAMELISQGDRMISARHISTQWFFSVEDIVATISAILFRVQHRDLGSFKQGRCKRSFHVPDILGDNSMIFCRIRRRLRKEIVPFHTSLIYERLMYQLCPFAPIISPNVFSSSVRPGYRLLTINEPVPLLYNQTAWFVSEYNMDMLDSRMQPAPLKTSLQHLLDDIWFILTAKMA